MAKEETTNEMDAKRGRLHLDTSNMKSANCNFVVMQDDPNKVVLNFGFNQSPGTTRTNVRVKLLQQTVLDPATARQLKNMLVALFKKRDAGRSRAGGRKESGANGDET